MEAVCLIGGTSEASARMVLARSCALDRLPFGVDFRLLLSPLPVPAAAAVFVLRSNGLIFPVM